MIVDTPGVFDTNQYNEEVQDEIRRCIKLTLPGPHAFVFVLSAAAKFTDMNVCSIEHFVKYFGESIYNFITVLITWKDELDKHNQTLQEYIKSFPPILQMFVQRCGGRVYAFDNTLRGEEQNLQDKELMMAISKNVIANGNKCYTNNMYLEAENEINQSRAKRRQEQAEIQDTMTTLKNMSPKTEQSPKTGNVNALESGVNQVQLTQKTETGWMNKKVLTENKNTDIVLNQKMHDQMQKKIKHTMKPIRKWQRKHAHIGKLFSHSYNFES
mgnify:CR=1 FL=1